MAKHIHIHVGKKTKDTPAEESKLRQAKALIKQAQGLLGGPADSASDGDIRKAANMAWDDCASALRYLGKY